MRRVIRGRSIMTMRYDQCDQDYGASPGCDHTFSFRKSARIPVPRKLIIQFGRIGYLAMFANVSPAGVVAMAGPPGATTAREGITRLH